MAFVDRTSSERPPVYKGHYFSLQVVTVVDRFDGIGSVTLPKVYKHCAIISQNMLCQMLCNLTFEPRSVRRPVSGHTPARPGLKCGSIIPSYSE